MKIPRSQITPVLTNLSMKSDTNVQNLAREIAAYLLDENRTGELDSLLRDVIEMRAERGIVEITAVSAHELSAVVRSDIERQVRDQYPDAKDIIINERIDPTMVGGVRLELIDRQLDLTVRSKLNHFKALTAAERTA